MGKRTLSRSQLHRQNGWCPSKRQIQPKSLLTKIPNRLSGRFAEEAPVHRRSSRSIIRPRPISKRRSETLGTPVECYDKLVVVGEWKYSNASSVSTGCFFCGGGEAVVVCAVEDCGCVVCINCLKRGNATNRDFESAFLCPPCYSGQYGPLVPYRGFVGRTKRPLQIKAVFTHRTTLRRTHARPTLVVDIVIDDPEQLPYSTAFMAYQHLHSLMPGYVGYAKVPFDWMTTEGADAYEYAIEKLSTFLADGGHLSFVEQFIIFVTTPSVPNTSELHIGPNGAGSAHINWVFQSLFPPVFSDQLQRRSVYPSRMFLVAGFGFWKQSFIQSFFLSFGQRCNFSEVVGFGQPDLLLPFLNPFIAKVLTLCYYEEHSNYLSAAFEGQAGLGSQTDVYVVNVGQRQLHHFTWSHPGRCPFSCPLPVFCPKCALYTPWHRPHISPDHQNVTNTCAGCGYVKRTARPEGMKKWSKGKGMATGTEGDWYIREWQVQTLGEYLQETSVGEDGRKS